MRSSLLIFESSVLTKSIRKGAQTKFEFEKARAFFQLLLGTRNETRELFYFFFIIIQSSASHDEYFKSKYEMTRMHLGQTLGTQKSFQADAKRKLTSLSVSLNEKFLYNAY